MKIHSSTCGVFVIGLMFVSAWLYWWGSSRTHWIGLDCIIATAAILEVFAVTWLHWILRNLVDLCNIVDEYGG